METTPDVEKTTTPDVEKMSENEAPTRMSTPEEVEKIWASLNAELAVAKAADAQYERVNETKKRVVGTAKDYDEFKNFVACAEDGLTPLSSKEIAELRTGKPGWRKGIPCDGNASRRVVATQGDGCRVAVAGPNGDDSF